MDNKLKNKRDLERLTIDIVNDNNRKNKDKGKLLSFKKKEKQNIKNLIKKEWF